MFYEFPMLAERRLKEKGNSERPKIKMHILLHTQKITKLKRWAIS